MEVTGPFKQDRKGLLYLELSDISTYGICFPKYQKPYGIPQKKTTFYGIYGMDKYLIKRVTTDPLLINQIRYLNMLLKLVERQCLVPSADLPFAYCINDLEVLGGIISKYYRDSLSTQQIVCEHPFSELKKYYDHEANEIDNFISLILDILHILIELVEAGIYYTDIRTSNFIVYNNMVKIVDFEPGYVFFFDRFGLHLKKMLQSYGRMVNELRKRCGFKPNLFAPGETLYETEKRVSEYRKVLTR